MLILIFNKVGGIWIHAEILNIPWNDKLEDPSTKEFKAAKKMIETEVNISEIIKIFQNAYKTFTAYI